jgi:hypothetical protein
MDYAGSSLINVLLCKWVHNLKALLEVCEKWNLARGSRSRGLCFWRLSFPLHLPICHHISQPPWDEPLHCTMFSPWCSASPQVQNNVAKWPWTVATKIMTKISLFSSNLYFSCICYSNRKRD